MDTKTYNFKTDVLLSSVAENQGKNISRRPLGSMVLTIKLTSLTMSLHAEDSYLIDGILSPKKERIINTTMVSP